MPRQKAPSRPKDPDLNAARRCVVCLTSSDPNILYMGSGFALRASEDNRGPVLIVTCRHVVEMLGGLQHVRVQGKEVQPVPAAEDASAYDLAVLEVRDLSGVTPLHLSSVTPSVGDTCCVLGWHWLDNTLLIGETVRGTVADWTAYFSRKALDWVPGLKLNISEESIRVKPGYSGAPVLVHDEARRRWVAVGILTHSDDDAGRSAHAVAITYEFASALSGIGAAAPSVADADATNPDSALDPLDVDAEDPHKGRFGGKAANPKEGLELSAVFRRAFKNVFYFDAIVKVTDHSAAVGPFRFHLYPDYPKPIIWVRRQRADGTAMLDEIMSTGVYTLGVQVLKRGRWIPLEYDLRDMADLPKRFRSR